MSKIAEKSLKNLHNSNFVTDTVSPRSANGEILFKNLKLSKNSHFCSRICIKMTVFDPFMNAND